MNQYSLGTNLTVAALILVGLLLALPNIFGDDPAVQISRENGEAVQQATLSVIDESLKAADVSYEPGEIEDGRVLLRFGDVQSQLKSSDALREVLDGHIVALTFAPRTPGWLKALGLKPMSLGLDLRGGVHFAYEVDLQTGLNQYLETYVNDLRNRLRDERIPRQVAVRGAGVDVVINNEADRERAGEIVRDLDETITVTESTLDGKPRFRLELSEAQIKQRQDFAIQQNIVTLRNRVNQLGVAEPVVQRQGLNRIVVQLPGVQDPSQAERILDATATLEFRMVAQDEDPFEAARRNRAPLGTVLAYQRDGTPVLMKREVIVSGDQLTDATSGYSQGQPAVFVRLNGQGADRMLENTQANLGRPMAVLFIEQKPEKRVLPSGEEVIVTKKDETVISVATIQGVFSSNFQITGLTPFEAQDLSLLLRAGSLAAPIFKVEERTIGPSLGQDNIDKGRLAVVIGLLTVAVFMIAYYRVFGLVANLALLANLVLIVALLSVFQASLTLPGIAGIVLTVGMAVDANVLIFERIREELRNGSSPQASIKAGYEKAFSTIADANITTIIAALVLFMFGTGPIKGFAITLSLGIITSMFTAIVGTRAVVNLVYGGRQVDRLSIGGSV